MQKPSVIIPVRFASSRLPGKIMLPLLGKTVLWHVVNRAMKASLVKKVIIATTDSKADDITEQFCKKYNIPIFRGNELDVLGRYYECAKKFKLKNIVRLTQDCPLLDPNIIDECISEFIKNDYDYVSNSIEYTYPDGMDTEIFTFEALEKSAFEAELPSEREHVTGYMRNNQGFKIKNVYSKKNYPIFRLTLDYPEDYELIKNIYEGIGLDMFFIDDIIDYINLNPELLKLNQHIKPNDGFIKSYEEDRKFLRARESKSKDLE